MRACVKPPPTSLQASPTISHISHSSGEARRLGAVVTHVGCREQDLRLGADSRLDARTYTDRVKGGGIGEMRRDARPLESKAARLRPRGGGGAPSGWAPLWEYRAASEPPSAS